MNRKKREVSKFTHIVDPKVLEFLDLQSPKTKINYTTNIKKLLEFTGQTGEEILADSRAWSRKILLYRNWLLEQKYSSYYVQSNIGVVRSFFRTFDHELKIAKKDALKLGKRARLNEDKILDKAEIANCVNIGSMKEKYVLLGGVSVGLRSEDFVRITYGMFRAIDIDSETPIFVSRFNTLKECVDARLFISSDFRPIVKAVLAENPTAKDSDSVYTEHPKQLTYVLQRLAEKAGIDLHGKRYSFHCCRKYLFDRLSMHMSEGKAKCIVGKTCPEQAYLDDKTLRDCYAKAEKDICISNNNGTENKKKIADLELENKDLKEQLDKLRQEQNTVTSTNQKNETRIDELYRLITEMKERDNREGDKKI